LRRRTRPVCPPGCVPVLCAGLAAAGPGRGLRRAMAQNSRGWRSLSTGARSIHVLSAPS